MKLGRISSKETWPLYISFLFNLTIKSPLLSAGRNNVSNVLLLQITSIGKLHIALFNLGDCPLGMIVIS